MSQAALQAVAAAAFATLAVVLAWRLRLGMSRQLAVGAIRATAQLIAVGAALAAVFRVPALAGVFVAVMAVTAALTSGGRIGAIPGARWRAGVAILTPALAAVGLLLAIGAFDLTPRAVVPTAGIFIGGAMAACTLAGRRMLEGLDQSAADIEARLCLGDTARAALAPVITTAVRTAIIPVLDQTRSAGLVALPGTFVGLVLGGASPAEAARVQLLVLLGLLAVELISAQLVSELIARAVIAPGERVQSVSELRPAPGGQETGP